MAETDAAALYAREVVATRVFDASRDVMWRAWSEPALVSAWWGPKGFSDTTHQFEFQAGGAWRHTMHGPDGKDYENEAAFVDIVPQERIVMDHLSWPHFRLTVTFDEIGERTKVTFRQLFASVADYQKLRAIAVPANEENFDKLAAVLTTMQT